MEGNSSSRQIAGLSEQVKWVRGHVTDLASDPLIDTLHMLIKSLTTPSVRSAPATLLGTPDLRPLAQATNHNPHLGMQVLGPATTEARCLAPPRMLRHSDSLWVLRNRGPRPLAKWTKNYRDRQARRACPRL